MGDELPGYLGTLRNRPRHDRHRSADETPLAWLAVALIFAAFGQLIARGVAMRAELDTVI